MIETVRGIDLPQKIRDILGVEATDEQVAEIARRTYAYDGDYYRPSVTPERFWEIVEAVLERMTPAELRSTREAIGHSIEDLARTLKKSRSMVQKWEAGQSLIPAGVAAEVEALQDAYADELDAMLKAAPATVTVWPGGLDEYSWKTTGRPSRWHRQIAAAVRLEHGTRIEYAEDPMPHDPMLLLDQLPR